MSVALLVALSVGVPLSCAANEKVIFSPTTGLPLPSSTAAVMVEVPPGLTALGAAFMPIAAAAPAVKDTLVLAV